MVTINLTDCLFVIIGPSVLLLSDSICKNVNGIVGLDVEVFPDLTLSQMTCEFSALSEVSDYSSFWNERYSNT